MKNLDNIYQRLTPHERFRVAVEAISRHDWTEMDRLNGTCEETVIRMQEPAYFERLRAITNLGMLHGIAVRDLIIALWSAAAMA